MTTKKKHEAGTVLLATALFLTTLLAFCAVATEGGRWFLVRAELSKSVDAGALMGAKNISNPNASALTLAEDFCAENFANGYLGTPGAGTGMATFHAEMVGTNKVKVDGHASAVAILGKIVGFNLVPVSASGAASMREVEIMMILDRSGSMQGQQMTDLKNAARNFVDFFTDTQAKDKMALTTFSTGVTIDRPMGTNYVTSMKTAIGNMVANGWTNSEDAIDQADGPQGFTNQNGVPSDARVQQVAIFFSDGFPTAFRSTFKIKNVVYDAVVHSDGDCTGPTGNGMSNNDDLCRPDNGQGMGAAFVPLPTGDGVFPASKCGVNKTTTRWYVLDTYPVSGYAPDACSIPNTTLGNKLCATADAMAIAKAKALKDAGVTVFTIGLGKSTDIDPAFLAAIASSPDMAKIAPTSADLQAIFTRVAQDIKLRLVQ